MELAIAYFLTAAITMFIAWAGVSYSIMKRKRDRIYDIMYLSRIRHGLRMIPGIKCPHIVAKDQGQILVLTYSPKHSYDSEVGFEIKRYDDFGDVVSRIIVFCENDRDSIWNLIDEFVHNGPDTLSPQFNTLKLDSGISIETEMGAKFVAVDEDSSDAMSRSVRFSNEEQLNELWEEFKQSVPYRRWFADNVFDGNSERYRKLVEDELE